MSAVEAPWRGGISDADVFRLPPRFHTPTGRLQLLVKRFCDILLASTSMVVLAPLFGAIALLVLITSGPPVFYRWRVVGRRGQFFRGYKFRTMVRDADEQLARLVQYNEMSGPVFKMKRDPRVTRIGHVLRKTSLDELPQLWSVLVGHMSLVGPRPPQQTEWKRFLQWQRQKLAVTPGMTCRWQVMGRSNITTFDDWVKMDIEYINSWSLALDFKILLQTIGAVFQGRGAH